MPKKNKGSAEDEVIGYCNYCKDEIYEHDDFVSNNGKRFHLDCYKLIQEELEADESEA